MVTTQLHLGDNCSNCGQTAQQHLQNPFGIRLQIKTWSDRLNSYVLDQFFCRDFVCDDGVTLERNVLFARVSSS